MSNIKRLESYEDLIAELKDRQIPFRKAEKKTAIGIPTRLGDVNAMMHIHWEPIPKAIRFMQVLPLSVPKVHRGMMTILLNRINFTLPVTGFVMNEKQGLLSYRVQAFLDPKGAIASDTVGSLYDLSIRVAKRYLPRFQKALQPPGDTPHASLFDLV